MSSSPTLVSKFGANVCTGLDTELWTTHTEATSITAFLAASVALAFSAQDSNLWCQVRQQMQHLASEAGGKHCGLTGVCPPCAHGHHRKGGNQADDTPLVLQAGHMLDTRPWLQKTPCILPWFLAPGDRTGLARHRYYSRLDGCLQQTSGSDAVPSWPPWESAPFSPTLAVSA